MGINRSHTSTHSINHISKNDLIEFLRKRLIQRNQEGNIPMYKPSDAHAQRLTYSQYYASNIAKGAVFIQLCGWMGTHDLWTGAVSDSEYMNRSGILKQQQRYLHDCDKDNKHIPWINILDKGYRVTSAAWRAGGQFVLQPSFAKSDTKFTTLQTLRSAAIASNRGGNERAVRLSKMSYYIRLGLLGNEDTKRLNNVWLAWGFICNFIFRPVH